MHVVWTGIHAMVDDPALIRRFPHQTWNASLRFDQETGDHAACLWGVRSLFLTSLTRGAATMDGVHPLTGTALAEALVLLRAMELVADGDTSLLLQNTTTMVRGCPFPGFFFLPLRILFLIRFYFPSHALDSSQISFQ